MGKKTVEVSSEPELISQQKTIQGIIFHFATKDHQVISRYFTDEELESGAVPHL